MEERAGNKGVFRYKSKRRLASSILMLAILFVLVFYVYTIEIKQPAVVFRGVLLGATILWAALTGAVLSQALLIRQLQKIAPPLPPDYTKLIQEYETLKMINSELLKKYEDLNMLYIDLSNRNQRLSDLLSSREQELNYLKNAYETLKRRMEVELAASDLAEWRRSVIERVNLVGRDYTIIFMLVKQADELARSGNKIGARAVLQAAYNLLQDRLVDRKLILLWEIGERPPADLQGAIRG